MSSVPTPIAFLLIDSQSGFSDPTHWGTERSTPSYESSIRKLLSSFRFLAAKNSLTTSIIHVHHSSLSPNSPLHPSKPGFESYAWCAPEEGETVIVKHENSAFVGTSLEKILRDRGVKRLYVGGLTTDHCVSTTVRMAANLHVLNPQYQYETVDGAGKQISDRAQEKDGEVVVVSDATATWGKGGFDAETVHAVHLASLSGEFAMVKSVTEVIKELHQQRGLEV